MTVNNVAVRPAIIWRKLPGIAVLSLSCLASTMQLAYAQDPAQNAAALNFVGADIESVVKAIGHYTGNTFIIDPRVKGQINLVSEKPLTKEQAFKLLTSTLRLQGYAVVTADGYTKVVPEADAKLQAGPTQVSAVKGDQIATQIFRLNYESVNNIVTVLRPLISPNNTINANPGNNSIVITDYADNLKRLGKIIAGLDVPANNDMDVILIKHAIASDIATLVLRLTEGQAGGDSGRTVLLADPRTNSVLLKAPSAARANLVKALIDKLDQPTTMPGNVHVVYLKNAEAVKLAQTLRSILSSDSALPSNSSSNSGLSAASTTSSTNSGQSKDGNSNAGSASSLPSSSGGSQSSASGGGYIQADAATNTLIITASEAVYRNLRGVIEQLDARRAQVYVEALIVEVSPENTLDFGVQWLAATGDKNSNYRVAGATSFSTAGDNIFNLAAGNATKVGSVLPTNGLSVGIFRQIGSQLGLGALAHAIASDKNNNVLSIPTLLTLDNEEAKIVVGENVPFVTGSYAQQGTGTPSASPFTTVERKDVGIKLTIKPQISQGGTVKLAIYQEVSDVVPGSGGDKNGPTTNQRSISTNVLVDDGDIIALGGLIDNKTTSGTEKIPLLGDIPFLGNLFKYQTKGGKKKNLMVFIRPTVIRTAEQANKVSLDRYDYLKSEYIRSLENGQSDFNLNIEKGKLVNPMPANQVKNKTPDSAGEK
ncbi:type II secretion system secretin GspD [Undibacterium parvum]|uniref:Type II secretion system protein GspD n=1 Tax=Undibacterium parvum TaxID=401471 RepID=A0A3S9HFA3_9BURK|nr:type II secretion system secretin GspD [Undibacterium parvum]AZP10788.1 type II secretion system protein GspD [Undibacterium parvum]